MESTGESRREKRIRRSTFDSTLTSNNNTTTSSPKRISTLLDAPVVINNNNLRSISVSHISGGGGGGGASALLDPETKRQTKRALRHTIGSIPMHPLAEETTIDSIIQTYLPDISTQNIASSMKKKTVDEKIKPIITSTPFELLALENTSPSPTFLRRQQSDMISTKSIRPTTEDVPSFPPLSALLNSKSRTDSFMTYASTTTDSLRLIRSKEEKTQFPESSKSTSAAVPSRKCSKSSVSSILLRLRLGGGAIIAGPLAKDAIEGMALQQKELKILKDAFDKIDDEKESFITSAKLFAVLEKMGYKKNNFAMKVYQLIDLEGNGKGNVGFGEFVRLSATFLMFTFDDMLRYVFSCYNKKGRGMFGIEDFSDLTADINTVVMGGGPRKWADVLKYELVNPYDTSKKGYLTEEEFIKMSIDYPSLVCFATKLQTILRDLCLGERFYKKLLHRQERAHAIEEYRTTHFGELPKEEFSMQSWFRKVSFIASIDDEPDLAKRDNTKLLELGFGYYTKLQKNNRIPVL